MEMIFSFLRLACPAFAPVHCITCVWVTRTKLCKRQRPNETWLCCRRRWQKPKITFHSAFEDDRQCLPSPSCAVAVGFSFSCFSVAPLAQSSSRLMFAWIYSVAIHSSHSSSQRMCAICRCHWVFICSLFAQRMSEQQVWNRRAHMQMYIHRNSFDGVPLCAVCTSFGFTELQHSKDKTNWKTVWPGGASFAKWK